MHTSNDGIQLAARLTGRRAIAALFTLLALAASPFAAPSARAEDARLIILHTTDLHGALDAWD